MTALLLGASNALCQRCPHQTDTVPQVVRRTDFKSAGEELRRVPASPSHTRGLSRTGTRTQQHSGGEREESTVTCLES